MRQLFRSVSKKGIPEVSLHRAWRELIDSNRFGLYRKQSFITRTNTNQVFNLFHSLSDTGQLHRRVIAMDRFTANETFLALWARKKNVETATTVGPSGFSTLRRSVCKLWCLTESGRKYSENGSPFEICQAIKKAVSYRKRFIYVYTRKAPFVIWKATLASLAFPPRTENASRYAYVARSFVMQ